MLNASIAKPTTSPAFTSNRPASTPKKESLVPQQPSFATSGAKEAQHSTPVLFGNVLTDIAGGFLAALTALTPMSGAATQALSTPAVAQTANAPQASESWLTPQQIKELDERIQRQRSPEAIPDTVKTGYGSATLSTYSPNFDLTVTGYDKNKKPLFVILVDVQSHQDPKTVFMIGSSTNIKGNRVNDINDYEKVMEALVLAQGLR